MPSWSELKRFLDRDGWELYRETDHFFFRKKTFDGSLLLTKVSKSSKEIPSNLWKHILKKQLRVTQEYFNKNK